MITQMVSSLEHQFNFDIIMLIDRIQERITLKVTIHTLSAFWWQSGLLVTVSQCKKYKLVHFVRFCQTPIL